MDTKPPRPGDKCECAECSGRLMVYCTRLNIIANRRIRYLCCNTCKHRPERNIWVLPLEYAPPRPAY